MAQALVPWGWAPKTWMQDIWQTYKLNHEKWKALYVRQGGKCAGCEQGLAHPTIKDMGKFGLKPQVDHRHVEGKQCEEEDVRGLLCGECNRLLGKIQDNRVVLANLLAYLKQHGDY